jgi:carbonic anhydrase
VLARAVLDPEATVREDVAQLRSSSAIPDRVTFSGHVYDVQTGRVRTVVGPSSRRPPSR